MLTFDVIVLCCIILRLISSVEAVPTNTDDEDFDWQRYLQDWSNPSSPVQHLTPHQYSSGSIHFPGVSDIHGASVNNEEPAGIRHDVGLTRSPNRWQESPSLSDQAQSWNAPSTSLPSTPHDFVHSPQEISQADLDFLNQILSRTNDRIGPSDDSQHAAEVINAASSTSQDHQRRRGSSRKRPLPIESSIKDTDISNTIPESRKRNALRKWPEPEFLKSIPYQPKIDLHGDQRGKLMYDIKKGLVGGLSSQLFAGKLHVVDDRILYYLRDDIMYKKWPLGRSSRRLPLATTTTADGTKLRIHLTLQNSYTSSNYLKGTVLENRPFHMVFGVPETLDAKINPIVYYGAGYIDPKDNFEVDRHYSSLLAKGAEEIHL